MPAIYSVLFQQFAVKPAAMGYTTPLIGNRKDNNKVTGRKKGKHLQVKYMMSILS
jgi:uncharacterized membrane protein